MLYDMLSNCSKSTDCKIKESKDRGVYVENLTTFPLKSTEDFVSAYDFILRKIQDREQAVPKKGS